MGQITNIDRENKIITGILIDFNDEKYANIDREKFLDSIKELNKNHKNNPYYGGFDHQVRDNRGNIPLSDTRLVLENAVVTDNDVSIDLRFLPIPKSSQLFRDIIEVQDKSMPIPLIIAPVIRDGEIISADLVPDPNAKAGYTIWGSKTVPAPKSSFISNKIVLTNLINDISSVLTGYMDSNITSDDAKGAIGKLICDFVCGITGQNVNPDLIQMEFKIENGAVVLVPQNFINALWAMGVGVMEDDLLDDTTYDDDIAVYKWEEDKKFLLVEPKMALYNMKHTN